MVEYTLRIELLGNPSQDVYKDLHARMQRGGFSQTITGTSSNGQSVTKPLPHATYYGSVEATAAGVRDWAQAHAKEAWGKSIVFVAATSTWARGES
jgi:hypothetical protein